jgi:hypothetical protein
MLQQILDNFGVAPVLPEQRRVTVAESMPAFQWNAKLCSDGLDLELHNLGHPEGLLPFYLRTGKDVVTVSSVRRFLPPRKQLSNQIIIERNLLLEASVFTSPMCCFTMLRMA